MKKPLMLSLTATCCLFGAEVYDLGVIEVSAKADIHATSTDSVDSKKIENARDKTILEALRTQPGIFVSSSGQRNEEQVRIRSFHNSRVGMFLDGIPVYVPYDKNIDYNRFTTYDIGEINIQKGYVSPFLGANTMGGAINLITKRPTSEFEGELGAGFFSGKGYDQFINLGTNQDYFYGILSFSNSKQDYFKVANQNDPHGVAGGNKRANSDKKDMKVNLKVGITPNETDEYSFNYIVQRGQKGQPYYDGDMNAPFVGRGMKLRHWYWPDWDKTSYYFLSKTAFADEFITLKTKFYRDEFYNKLELYPNLPRSGNPDLSEYDDYTMGGQIELDFKFNEANILKLSVALKNDNHKVIDSTSPGADLTNKAQTYSYAGEYTWAINNYFTWVVGASYDYNKIKKAEYRNQAQTAVEGEWEKYNASAFNPQTILYFTPFNGTNFYASVSQRTNFPTLKDRYSTRFGQYEPNPDLSEEKATNYEIGVSQLIANNTLLKFALFHTKTKDYITQIRTSSGLNKNVNVGKEEQTGFEFSVDSQILDNLSVFGNYTYMHARIKDDDENKYIVGVPEHSLFAGLIYSPIKQIDIIPQVRYESKRYASSAISDKDFVNKSYTLADIKIAYRPIDDFELNFRVNNIFDEDYSYAYGYPAQGRNYYAGFKYSF